MYNLLKRNLAITTLGLSMLLAPATTFAASVQCSSDHGTCEVSNENNTSWVSCDCEGGLGATGGTGLDDWQGLSQAELMEICQAELSVCEAIEDTGEGTTGGDPTTGGTTGDNPTTGDGTTGGDPTSGGGTTGGESTTGETGESTTTSPTAGETDEPTGFETTDSGTDGTDGSDGEDVTSTTSETDGETLMGVETTDSGTDDGGSEGPTEGHDSDHATDGGNNDEDMNGCSIGATPGGASLLGLGLLLGLGGLRNKRSRC